MRVQLSSLLLSFANVNEWPPEIVFAARKEGPDFYCGKKYHEKIHKTENTKHVHLAYIFLFFIFFLIFLGRGSFKTGSDCVA